MADHELKATMEQWQEALRRFDYLQAMREALPPGPTAYALDKKIAHAKTEVDRLQTALFGSSRP